MELNYEYSVCALMYCWDVGKIDLVFRDNNYFDDDLNSFGGRCGVDKRGMLVRFDARDVYADADAVYADVETYVEKYCAIHFHGLMVAYCCYYVDRCSFDDFVLLVMLWLELDATYGGLHLVCMMVEYLAPSIDRRRECVLPAHQQLPINYNKYFIKTKLAEFDNKI